MHRNWVSPAPISGEMVPHPPHATILRAPRGDCFFRESRSERCADPRVEHGHVMAVAVDTPDRSLAQLHRTCTGYPEHPVGVASRRVASGQASVGGVGPASEKLGVHSLASAANNMTSHLSPCQTPCERIVPS